MTIVYKYTATPKFSVVLRHWMKPYMHSYQHLMSFRIK